MSLKIFSFEDMGNMKCFLSLSWYILNIFFSLQMCLYFPCFLLKTNVGCADFQTSSQSIASKKTPEMIRVCKFNETSKRERANRSQESLSPQPIPTCGPSSELKKTTKEQNKNSKKIYRNLQKPTAGLLFSPFISD
uniref:Uncharacterized protein n=1 Tax=Coturnix japonica TaxID=93934 RepID=A0A8C2T8C9_COTJA